VKTILICVILCLLLVAFRVAGSAVPEFTAEGFRVPQPGAELHFPEDHGSHPDFKIEWWYLTGHLLSESGRRFGFQATFFRRAREASAEDETDPAFALDQVYLAHLALSDPGGDAFHFEEKISREGWDAWARSGKLDLRNGSWTLKGNFDDHPKLRLQGGIGTDVRLEMELEPEKPLVRFGEDGTSRKGPSSESRSYYLSFTRLGTSGTIMVGDESLKVAGSSWMDHEIASSQLEPGYTGWDWVAIQLADGWEVKAYLLRMENERISPFSALIWIDPEGKTYPGGPEKFTWEKRSWWKSPHTGTRYPVGPEITGTHPLTGEPVSFRIIPVMEDQELVLPGTTYWEGAGTVLDASGREIGRSYLELVGYAGPIEGLR